jgi:hypothetical protein
MTKVEKLVRQYDMLKAARASFDSVYQDLADFILPTRHNVLAKRTPGQRQTERLFDSTAPDSANRLAAFVSGSLTNMAIQWFSLKMSDEELNADRDTQLWLEVCAQRIYNAFRASNFTTESQEMYLDLAVFGTGCFLVEERKRDDQVGFGGFLFRTDQVASYVISENPEGVVDTVMRTYKLSLAAAVKKFGLQTLSQASQEKLIRTPFEKIEILHVVQPRFVVKAGKMAANMPFESYECELERKHPLAEGGYEEQPFLVVRWSKTSGEDYGRGPGHTALPDIMTLNKADELTLRGWGKIIDPPLLAREDGVIGRIRTQPSAITVVRDLDALKPMDQGGRWDVNAALTADRRESIKRMFFADQLQLPDKTIFTATEVERRIELMQQVLGPTVGRLEYEFLNPLISRCFKLMMRAGALPDPPQVVKDYVAQTHVEIGVQYEGPLARAQRAGDLQAFTRLTQGMMQVVQLNPQTHIADNLDDDATFKMLVESSGVKKGLQRTPEDVQAVREERAEAEAAAQQAQLDQANADTISKGAGAAAQLGPLLQAPPQGVPQ